MCFNSSISINTFAFSMFATIFGFVNGILSLNMVGLMTSFVIVQLLEWRTWTLLDARKPVDKLTALAYPFIFLLLQPAAAVALYMNQQKTVESRIGAFWTQKVNVLVLASLAALWILGAWVYSRYVPEIKPSRVNGRLMYNLKDPEQKLLGTMILVFYMLTVVIPTCLAAPLWAAVITLVTLVVSLIGWWTTRTWGTMWCYTANFTAIWIVFLVFRKSYVTA